MPLFSKRFARTTTFCLGLLAGCAPPDSQEPATPGSTPQSVIVGTSFSSVGDPHETSGDGLRYDNQRSGFFVGLQSDGVEYEGPWRLMLQKEHRRADELGLPWGSFTVNVAAALQVGPAWVRYRADGDALEVDGQRVLLPQGATRPLAGGGTLSRASNVLTVTSPVGDTVSFTDQGRYLDIHGNLSFLRGSQRVKGSLGCFDADQMRANDMCLRDGTLTLNTERFLDAWTVARGESLFGEAGPLPAGATLTTVDATLYDASRPEGGAPREVPVRLHYPAGAGNLPVVFVSHGLGGSREGLAYLGQAFARAGYVAVHVTHRGSDSSVCAGLLFNSPECQRRLSAAGSNSLNRVRRPRDVSFLIDSLAQLEALVGPSGTHLDGSRLAVAGHSFGAYTVMALAGAKVDMPEGTDRVFADTRLRAFVALSPQGPGQVGLDESSWSNITAPVMTMTGTYDASEFGDEPASWRLIPMTRMPAGDKFALWLYGAYHSTFASSGTPEQQATISTAATQMLDAYVKQSQTVRGVLLREEWELSAPAAIDMCSKFPDNPPTSGVCAGQVP